MKDNLKQKIDLLDGNDEYTEDFNLFNNITDEELDEDEIIIKQRLKKNLFENVFGV
jgi:hypothetical protein